MATNQNDGYVKVEDTLPASKESKELVDVSWPTKTEKKSMRTLGSFSYHERKESDAIDDTYVTMSKSDSSVSMPTSSSTKESTTIDSVSTSLAKESVTVDSTQHESKEQSDISISADVLSKSSTTIDDSVTSQKKEADDISLSARQNKKEDDSVSVKEDSLSKTEKGVSVTQDQLSKTEKSVSVTEDSLSKTEKILSSIPAHDKKSETEIASTTSESKKETEIASTTPESKTETEIASTTHQAKEETEIDSTTPQSKTETEIASTTPESKTETEIASTTPESKTETEIDSTTPQSKTETEIASTIAEKKSETKITMDLATQKKTPSVTYDDLLAEYISDAEAAQKTKKASPSYTTSIDTTTGLTFSNDTNVNFSKVTVLSKDSVVENDYSTTLGSSDKGIFDDILPYSISVHTKSLKEANAGFADNNVPSVYGVDLKKSDGTYEQVGLANYDLSSATVAVETGDGNEKTAVSTSITAASTEYDTSGNYVSSNRTDVKTTDDISDNTISVSSSRDGNKGSSSTKYSVSSVSTNITSNNYDEDVTRKSLKIADQGSTIYTYNSYDPVSYSSDSDAYAYAKVRNTDSYVPVYDLTTLIPPRTGILDTLKTLKQTLLGTNYTSVKIFQPDINNDATRFIERAVTGEIARFVYSRIYSSVLLGNNATKLKEREDEPIQFSTDGVLDAVDKVFDVVNPVINAISNIKLSEADTELLEYHGIIGNMSDQIDKTASSYYASYGDYYNAVRAKVLNKLAGNSTKLTEINTKLTAYEAERDLNQNNPAYTTKPSLRGGDAEGKSKLDTLKSQIEALKKDKKNISDNIKKLNRQYKEVIIQFSTPTEYENYFDESKDTYDSQFSPFRVGGKAYSIDNNRSISGPRKDTGNHDISESYLPDKDKKAKMDWRSFNINRKPQNTDDFSNTDSNKGYLFDDTYNVITQLQKSMINSLGEVGTYKPEDITKMVNDAVDFKYIFLKDASSETYKDSFINIVSDLQSYYGGATVKRDNNLVSDSATKSSAYFNFKPSEETSSNLYSNLIDASKTIIRTNIKSNDKYTVKESSSYDDSSIRYLFESEYQSIINPRYTLIDTIANSSDTNIKNNKNGVYVLKEGGWLYSVADENTSIDLSRVQSPSGSKYFYNLVAQDQLKATDKDGNTVEVSDPDAKRQNKELLYQATLNYLSKDDTSYLNLSTKRNIRKTLFESTKNDNITSDNPLGSGYKNYDTLKNFAWFNTTDAEGNRLADITHLLVEDVRSYNKISSVKYNISSDASNIIDMIADSSKNSKDVYKTYSNMLEPSSSPTTSVSPIVLTDKIMTPLFKSVVGEKGYGLNDIYVVHVDATIENGKQTAAAATKYVTDKSTAKNDSTNTFNEVFVDGSATTESSRNNKTDSYYAKVTTKKKSMLAPVSKKDKVFSNDTNEIDLKFTGLGGLCVSTGYSIDRKFPSSNSLYFEIPFEFNPEITGESRSANWNGVTAFGRTHEHYVYSNSSARSISFKTSYAVLDSKEKEPYDIYGNQITKDADIERNSQMDWAKGWNEDYILMVLNMYRSLVLPQSAYGSVTPPVISIDFGKYLSTYTRVNDKYLNARWIVSEYSIDPNLEAGYSLNKTPRLYDVTLSLKEVFSGWHDAQDFYIINSHLYNWESGGQTEEFTALT